MTASDLAAYVSPDAPLRETALAFVAQCWDSAALLVSQHIGSTAVVLGSTTALIEDPNNPGFWTLPASGAGAVSVTSDIPAAIVDRAIIEVGAELFHRRQAPNGISQFAMPNGPAPVRVARDPMVAARDLLSPFLGSGIA